MVKNKQNNKDKNSKRALLPSSSTTTSKKKVRVVSNDSSSSWCSSSSSQQDHQHQENPFLGSAISANKKPSSCHVGILSKRQQQKQQQLQEDILKLCGTCNQPLHMPPQAIASPLSTSSPPKKKRNSSSVPNATNSSKSLVGGKKQNETNDTYTPFSVSTCSPCSTTTINATAATAGIEENKIPTKTIDQHVITCSNYSKDPALSKCRTLQSNKEKQKRTKHSFPSHKSRSTMTSKNVSLSSPHFHLCCSGIPPNSSLYSKLYIELEKKELKKKEKLERRVSSCSSTNTVVTAGSSVTANSSTDGSTITTSSAITTDRTSANNIASSSSGGYGRNGNISPVVPETHSNSSTSSKSSSSSSPVPFYNHNNSNNKAAVAQFLCPACDIKGTSMYLYEYFSKIQELKAQCYSDDESIYTIQPVGYILDNNNKYNTSNNDNNINNYEIKGKKHQSQSRMGKDNGFVRFLIERQIQQEKLKHSSTYKSELSYKNTELRLDHIQNILERIPSSLSNMGLNNDDYDNNIGSGHIATEKNYAQKIDSKYLVGQPIRLFCDVSNCYYTGRIIASKVVDFKDLDRLKESTKRNYRNESLAQCCKTYETCIINDGNIPGKTIHSTNEDKNSVLNTRQHILLDRDIGRTQYLIRFRAGVEGRKVPIHEWIFLEEHPIMVAVSLVWANTDLCTRSGQNQACQIDQSDSAKVSTPYHKITSANLRPVQLFVRTALEMLTVDEINRFPPLENFEESQIDNFSSSTSNSVSTIGIFFTRSFQTMILELGNMHHCKLTNSVITKTNDGSIEDGVMKKVSSVLGSCMGGFITASKSFSLPGPAIKDNQNDLSEVCIQGEEKKDSDLLDSTKETNRVESSIFNFIIADFIKPPLKIRSYLERGKSSNEEFNISTSLATMEAEEQRRIKVQQGLT